MDLLHDYLELATPAGETIKVLRKSHPQARRLRLTVTPGGARVTYPEGTHPAQVFAFLRKHGEWLERKLDELSLGSAPPALKPGAATVMPLRGETTRLSWRDGAYPRIEQVDDRLVLTLPRPHGKSTLPAARALLRSFLGVGLRVGFAAWPVFALTPALLCFLTQKRHPHTHTHTFTYIHTNTKTPRTKHTYFAAELWVCSVALFRGP